MVKRLYIPDKFQYPFKRLINLVPYKQRNERDTHKIILLYLQLGEKNWRGNISKSSNRIFVKTKIELNLQKNLTMPGISPPTLIFLKMKILKMKI